MVQVEAEGAGVSEAAPSGSVAVAGTDIDGTNSEDDDDGLMQEEDGGDVEPDSGEKETISAVIGAWGVPRNARAGTATTKFNLR